MDSIEKHKDKKILILGINYYSDDSACRFVNSFKDYLNEDVECVLIDNTVRDSSNNFFSKIKKISPLVQTIKPECNLGYFGGAQYGFEYYQKKNNEYPDWIIVSNVDLVFSDPNFFKLLLKINNFPDLGVIAPRIFSKLSKIDLNTKIVNRPSKLYMKFIKVILSNYYAFTIYTFFSYIKKKIMSYKEALTLGSNKIQIQGKNSDFLKIYAPHGSCIVFHKRFFQKGGSLDYPSFLFGEEIFVAETARKLDLKIIYYFKLKILDYEHASTGIIKNKRMVGYFKDSINIIVDQYFS
jgi:GT2 family glycosyltransferase